MRKKTRRTVKKVRKPVKRSAKGYSRGQNPKKK